MDSSVSLEDRFWFLRVCHHIPFSVYRWWDWWEAARQGVGENPWFVFVWPELVTSISDMWTGNWRIKKPTRCHLLFYCSSYWLIMFRALLCPSSGARDYDIDYHIGRFGLGLLYVGGQVQPGHYSGLTAPDLQHTANRDRNDQCCNQHHSRELLMMGIVMPETC